MLSLNHKFVTILEKWFYPISVAPWVLKTIQLDFVLLVEEVFSTPADL